VADPMSSTVDEAPHAVDEEVVDLCRDLLRIDTSNPIKPERPAAEYVAERLAEVGLDPEIFESEPGRASVVARVEGADSSRDALLIHGHLDVVPADPTHWSVHPFSGEIRDGCLWGRGAVDMKHMDAMALSVVRHRLRSGRQPSRDVVLAFVADEEAGGGKGARWLVDNHSGLFEDCSEAISEVGGFSFTVRDDLRLYAVETAEKGMGWLRLTATGRAGHGSMLNDDNAIAALAEALTRLSRHRFPIQLTKSVHTFLEALCEAYGVSFDENRPDEVLLRLGAPAVMIGATLRHTAQATMLEAGYKSNVVPQTASAVVDARVLPGLEDEFYAVLDELLGDRITREFLFHDVAYETDFDGPLVDAMGTALRSEDPGARAVPYCISAGTDAKSFSRLGIRCFGFSPLRLPPELDFFGMFHGVDERVPIDGLQFGTRVLDRFLDLC
jgi:acetylornithine deacetylase/succinyl-diaminopimelate desuccinylase-like protein